MTEADGEVRALEPVEVVVRLTAERMAARAARASGLTGQCSVRSIAGEGGERGGRGRSGEWMVITFERVAARTGLPLAPLLF